MPSPLAESLVDGLKAEEAEDKVLQSTISDLTLLGGVRLAMIAWTFSFPSFPSQATDATKMRHSTTQTKWNLENGQIRQNYLTRNDCIKRLDPSGGPQKLDRASFSRNRGPNVRHV